jgi:hypothetical protein
MNRVITLLTGRLGVFRTWASFGRVVVWVVVWCAVLSLLVAPRTPQLADREHPPDVPVSDVRYLGPTSHQDLAGFIAPDEASDEPFTVAWIGGSEVKLNGVSVAGEVSNRLTAFGGRRIQIDAYTLIAPRPIDVLRALDSARANGVDAVVISINAVWLTDEWSMREWPNLDVSNIGTLWSRPSAWPWAASLTSPADAVWRVTRAAFSIVEAQNRLNEHARDVVDAIDVVARGEDLDAAVGPDRDELDPRLPSDATEFWLVQEYGPSVMDNATRRVALMVEGLDDDSPVADALNLRLIEDAEAAAVPVFLYVHPFSPDALADPDFAIAAQQVEAYWTQLARRVTSPLVEVEPQVLTSLFADRANYIDVVHMVDAGPFAEVLVPRLCANWQTANPTKECS